MEKNEDAPQDGSGPDAEEPVLYADLEYWMSRLPAPLQTISIIHLAIPGSHDTMTYTIQPHNDVGPDGDKIIRFLGRYFSLITKPIIFRWSVTQHSDIKAQLSGGIRYLDFRLATKPDDKHLYFLHGLYGGEISQPLQDIVDWLSSHPGEVLVLDFQHFYKFETSHHQFLIEKLNSLFKGKLCPVSHKFDHISLQWLALKKYQVLVIYRNDAASGQTFLWNRGMWRTPWPNTVNTNQLVRFLNKGLRQRPSEAGFVSQCVLTPDAMYVVKHLFCGGLEKCLGTVCRNVTLPWVHGKNPGTGGLNVVITDFVSYNNFMFSKDVIQRNAVLLKFKESTPSGDDNGAERFTFSESYTPLS